MKHDQHHNHNDVPGMCLDPLLEEQRRKLANHDHLIHFMLMENCPATYAFYLGTPLLCLLTFGAVWLTSSAFPQSRQDILLLGLAVVLGCATLCLGAFTICVPAVAFWRMNWFAKIVTVIAIFNMTRWRDLLGSPRDWFSDLFIAFAACAVSEVLWNAWRSRRSNEEEELNSL